MFNYSLFNDCLRLYLIKVKDIEDIRRAIASISKSKVYKYIPVKNIIIGSWIICPYPIIGGIVTVDNILPITEDGSINSPPGAIPVGHLKIGSVYP